MGRRVDLLLKGGLLNDRQKQEDIELSAMEIKPAGVAFEIMKLYERVNLASRRFKRLRASCRTSNNVVPRLSSLPRHNRHEFPAATFYTSKRLTTKKGSTATAIIIATALAGREGGRASHNSNNNNNNKSSNSSKEHLEKERKREEKYCTFGRFRHIKQIQISPTQRQCKEQGRKTCQITQRTQGSQTTKRGQQ